MKLIAGKYAVIEGDSHHAKWVEEHQSLNTDPWFARICCQKAQPGQLVVNVGANIGTLARALIDHGARVICIEPNPKAVACLRHNCPDAEMVLEMAMSDREGHCRFHEQENAGASFCTPDSDGNTVACGTLDGLFRYVQGPLSLLLADVEGWEVKLLRGGKETIAEYRPTIICEVNRGALERAGSSDGELFDLLDQYGYSIQVLQPDCRIGNEQYDILCLPK